MAGRPCDVYLLSWCLQCGCGYQTFTHSKLTVENKAACDRPGAIVCQERKTVISWGVGTLSEGRDLKHDFIVFF